MEGISYEDDAQEKAQEAYTGGHQGPTARRDVPPRIQTRSTTRRELSGRSHVGRSITTPDRVKRSTHTVRGGHITKQTPKTSALTRAKAKKEKMLALMMGSSEDTPDGSRSTPGEEELIWEAPYQPEFAEPTSKERLQASLDQASASASIYSNLIAKQRRQEHNLTSAGTAELGSIQVKKRRTTAKRGEYTGNNKNLGPEYSEIDDNREDAFDLSFGNLPYRDKKV